MSIIRKLSQKRPISYSQISSFEWNQNEWYDTYINGKPKDSNDAMRFGTLVGDSIGTPSSLVPTLTPPGVKEYEMRTTIDGIGLIGYADHYDPESHVLHENKTTDNRKKWTQRTVDNHKQLDMYALLLWKQDGVSPENVSMYLNDIPVEIRGVSYKMPEVPTYYQYKTSRTTTQVEAYIEHILKTVSLMEEVINTKGLPLGKIKW